MSRHSLKNCRRHARAGVRAAGRTEMRYGNRPRVAVHVRLALRRFQQAERELSVAIAIALGQPVPVRSDMLEDWVPAKRRAA